MKRLLPIAAVVTVLAALVVAGTASASPLGQYSGDLCVGGTPSASGSYGGSSPADAFDDNPSTFWSSDNTTGTSWLQYQFAAAVEVDRVSYRADTAAQAPDELTVLASDTGAFAGEEVVLYTQTGLTWSAAETKTFDFDNAASYGYYRLVLTNNSYVRAVEVEMQHDDTAAPTETPVATWEGGDIHVYVDYPTPVPQYFDPTANSGDGPEPWLLRFYVGVFVVFAFTYVLFRLVDTHQFYLLFMALCMAAAWVTRSVNGAGIVYLFMLLMLLVLKLWGGLQGIFRFGP